MTLEDALDLADAVAQGRIDFSPSSVLSGGPSPNDLHRARTLIMNEFAQMSAYPYPADTRLADDMHRAMADFSQADYDLNRAIQTHDPSGPVRGHNRQLDMDAARGRRRPAPTPRTPPGPPPETGMYDRLGRRYNPSFRASRTFHGTLPQATEAALRHPVLGKGMSRPARQAARMAAAKGVLGSLPGVGPLADYALDTESRTPTQFLRAQEEAITGMVPGTVSPSELPPPAALPPDRLKAVEATQGMAGVAPDTKSPNVTEQEVRAYISNKVAKGDKLPAWAEKITSMKNGRLSIKPVNPRTKARQEAAKRPHNPRMGQTKRKYGGY